jgi:hypothetical protein
LSKLPDNILSKIWELMDEHPNKTGKPIESWLAHHYRRKNHVDMTKRWWWTRWEHGGQQRIANKKPRQRSCSLAEAASLPTFSFRSELLSIEKL